MSRRRFNRPSAVEVLEVLAWVPTTGRKGWRIARVRQDGAEMAEIRACHFDPRWEPSPKDHRSTIQRSALGRIIAALVAAEAQIGGAP